MILPEDAPALTPPERMLVNSWTDEERQLVQRVFAPDEDIRSAIAYIVWRRDKVRDVLRASEDALQQKYGADT